MSVRYIGTDERYTRDRLVGLGFAYGVFGAVAIFAVGSASVVLATFLPVGETLLTFFAIWGMPFAVFLVPMWAGLPHRVGVVNFQRFALMGAIYAITVALIFFVFSGLFVSIVLDVFGLMVLIGLVAWVGFIISWLPVWAFTDRVVVVAPGHCVECNYNLRGLESEVCPECGRGFQFENEPCVLDDSDRASVN